MQHCTIHIQFIFWYFCGFLFETTIDICKFLRNYSTLPSHNGAYSLLASTSLSYDRNTCAEVTAFTPTCDTSPTSEPHEIHQHMHTPGWTEHICLSRLFHLHHSCNCMCVCVSACSCLCLCVSSRLPSLCSRRWTVWFSYSFSIPFNLTAYHIGTVALVQRSDTRTYTPNSEARQYGSCCDCCNVICCMFAYARQSPSHFIQCSFLRFCRVYTTNAGTLPHTHQKHSIIIRCCAVQCACATHLMWWWCVPFFLSTKNKNKMSYFNFNTKNSNVNTCISRNWI